MNVLLVTSHSIAEHDDLQMFARMGGVDVFSVGAYSDPAHPGDDKRPALPEAPDHPELRAAVDLQREVLGRAAFPLLVAPDLRLMDARLFTPEPVGLRLTERSMA